MYTYYSNSNLKEEALSKIKENLKGNANKYKWLFIGGVALTLIIFLLNAGATVDIGRYLLGSLMQSILPIILSIIGYTLYHKETYRPYKKMEQETITLYHDRLEYSCIMKGIKTTYKINYDDISSTHILYGKELVILAHRSRLETENLKTHLKKGENIFSLLRLELLFCYENGEEMYDKIKEEVSLCFDRRNELYGE